MSRLIKPDPNNYNYFVGTTAFVTLKIADVQWSVKEFEVLSNTGEKVKSSSFKMKAVVIPDDLVLQEPVVTDHHSFHLELEPQTDSSEKQWAVFLVNESVEKMTLKIDLQRVSIRGTSFEVAAEKVVSVPAPRGNRKQIFTIRQLGDSRLPSEVEIRLHVDLLRSAEKMEKYTRNLFFWKCTSVLLSLYSFSSFL